MSENPYQSVPSLANLGGVETLRKPGGLTAIPVICLIFGLCGSLVTLAGLIMLAYQGFNGGPPSMPTAGAPGIAQYQAEMHEFQNRQFVPNLIFNVCGFIVGSFLVVGSIGVLRLKEWGRTLLRNSLLFAAIFVALRGVYAAWVQYQTIGMLKGSLPPNVGGSNDAAYEIGMQIGIIAVIAVGIVWGAALVGFYLWSRSYLDKKSVTAFFETTN